jgi:pSer/pThr/pTyr-binding forkhead associated (FHA) protein
LGDPPGMSAQLVIIEGSNKGPIPLEDHVIFEIGRSEDADLHLDDPDVVPIHLKIYKENKEYHVFDLSGRGFLVNGRRRLKHHLQHDDIVAIGSHAIRFEQQLTDESNVDVGYTTEQIPAIAPEERDEDLAFQSQANLPPDNNNGEPTVELIAIKGNDSGKSFNIKDRPMSIMGRGIATDITVWDIRCSRVHCRIDGNGQEYTVSDMNSSNGTFVNGRQIKNPVLLKPGDTIKIGTTTLQFNQRP